MLDDLVQDLVVTGALDRTWHVLFLALRREMEGRRGTVGRLLPDRKATERRGRNPLEFAS
jgi:hypothetical protein